MFLLVENYQLTALHGLTFVKEFLEPNNTLVTTFFFIDAFADARH